MENDVHSQVRELENRIKQLRSKQLSELRQQLKEARAVVADFEHQIAKISGKTPAAPQSRPLRTRTPSEEVSGRIIKALSAAPKGLTQKEIATQAGLNYNTVVLYLKNHPKDFKSAGTLRSKRISLK